MGLFYFMKEKILKQLADFSRYAEGYNCSKDYDVLLWSNEKVKSLNNMLFIDYGIGDDLLCYCFDDWMETWGYKAHDYVLLHRSNFDRLTGYLEYQINEKYKG